MLAAWAARLGNRIRASAKSRSTFSLGFHELISRLSLEGRWRSRDTMARLTLQIPYAVILQRAFSNIWKSSRLTNYKCTMHSEIANPNQNPVGPKDTKTEPAIISLRNPPLRDAQLAFRHQIV